MPYRKKPHVNKKKSRGGIKDVRVFATASLLNDLGADMVRPLWPMFVTSVLGAPMAFLGLLDGIGEAVSHSVRLPSGYLSDKIRQHKAFVWLGYLLAGLARIGYALSAFASWLLPFKIMDRLGKLRDPPRDAMVVEKVSHRYRGRAFGILNSADNFGAMLGPIFAFFLFASLGFRNLFLFAAAPSIIGAALVWFFIKEKKHTKRYFHFKLRKLSTNFRLLTATTGLFALSWFSVSFMIVYATKFINVIYAPLMFVAMSFCASVISMPAGKISDSIGRKPVLILGYSLWMLMCIVLVFLGNLDIFTSILIFAINGIHYGIMNTVQSPFVAEMVKPDERATSIGIFQMTFGICSMIASIIAGLLWDNVSAVAPFIFAAVISATSIVLLAVLVKEK